MIRDARSCPDGLRVPAADLEQIVINAIASKFRDRAWMTSALADLGHASDAGPAIEGAMLLAGEIEQQQVNNTGMLRSTIAHIEVSKAAFKIQLDKTAIVKRLLPGRCDMHKTSARNETIDIIVSGRFLRCGKQVRLILGNNNQGQVKAE